MTSITVLPPLQINNSHTYSSPFQSDHSGAPSVTEGEPCTHMGRTQQTLDWVSRVGRRHSEGTGTRRRSHALLVFGLVAGLVLIFSLPGASAAPYSHQGDPWDPDATCAMGSPGCATLTITGFDPANPDADPNIDAGLGQGSAARSLLLPRHCRQHTSGQRSRASRASERHRPHREQRPQHRHRRPGPRHGRSAGRPLPDLDALAQPSDVGPARHDRGRRLHGRLLGRRRGRHRADRGQ